MKEHTVRDWDDVTEHVKYLESTLEACRANVAEKEGYIDKLLTENVSLKKEVEALKDTIKTWVLLAENVRRYAP